MLKNVNYHPYMMMALTAVIRGSLKFILCLLLGTADNANFLSFFSIQIPGKFKITCSVKSIFFSLNFQDFIISMSAFKFTYLFIY